MRLCKICQQPTGVSLARPTLCRLCDNARKRAVYAKNPEQYRASQRIREQRRSRRHSDIRLEALKHYGGEIPKCVCCGEEELAFLVLDHINNDGSKDRSPITGKRRTGPNLYYSLKQRSWPGGLQVLCWNCNAAKYYSGLCPHQKRRGELGFAPTR